MDHPVLGRTPAVGQAIEGVHAAVPHLVLADLSPSSTKLRWVKSAHDIARRRQAGRIGGAKNITAGVPARSSRCTP